MKSVPKQWNVYIIFQREKKINPKPQYQRGAVWNLTKKQKLIDSILRGYDIPKFYLRISSDPDFEHEVVDGQQRLRAIWEFKNGEYPLGEDSNDLPELGDLSEKYHDELPSDTMDKIGLFELNIVVIEQATDLEIRDLFLRLQEGVSLNPAEKRNAMPGNMRDFVADMAMHKVFQGVKMGPNAEERFGKDDWVSHVTCLEIAGNSVDIKATNLQKIYEDYQNFESDGTTAKKIKRVFNYMAKVLTPNVPEMDIKWGFVDLYWLISRLIDEYDLNGHESEFQTFYITFEQRRRSVDDIEELVKSDDYLERVMFDYLDAFQRSGATRKNVQTRHEVYQEWTHALIPDLVPKDSKRQYTRNERMIIWRRANETCQICHNKIPFEEMHADHIVPHSKGGKSTLANAQCLCATCNSQKGASN
ncbi:MAG: DUF262 domain-containing protein [Anaerolineae bacterium]|nr:DUF262 domain-containing protein [Anaerolineae bacterium]